MASTGGGWYDGRFGGGRWREDGADGLVLLELLLEVGVPVVLDVIVGPLREVRRNGRPSAYMYRGWSVTMHGRHGWIDDRSMSKVCMCVPVA